MIRQALFVLLCVGGLSGCFPRREWVDTGEHEDSDGDGFGDAFDCAPEDPAVHPAAMETCNGRDDDCDGLTDDEDDSVVGRSTWSIDADSDGYGDEDLAWEACDAGVSGAVQNDGDCDDTNASVYPSAEEVCDSVDNDCDGVVDDVPDGVAPTWYPDLDGDGFGDDAMAHVACAGPTAWIEAGGDCDDTDAAVHPGVDEACDGVDNDCDGTLDEDVEARFFRDRDGDGYGDPDVYLDQCPGPSGYVMEGTDCDDSAPLVHPGADEWCDGTDYDCDDVALEAGSLDAPTWYFDGDDDGYGDATVVRDACVVPDRYTADATDCDDTNAAIHPGADDWCSDWADGVDDDCDGVADDPTELYEFHADVDGDGYGATEVSATGCAPEPGLISDASDCDDLVADAHPGGIERYRWGIDYDCDGDLVHTSADAFARWPGGSSGDRAGNAVAGAGDLDGDGVDDLAIAAWRQDGGGSGSGAIYAVSGASVTAGSHDLEFEPWVAYGEAASDEAGWSLAFVGDTDGDGFDDLAVGAPGNDRGGGEAGAVYLAGGAWIAWGVAPLDLASATAVLVGEDDDDEAGTWVAAAGDTNGDGLDDLLVGAPGNPGSLGTVYLMESAFSAEMDLSRASRVLLGESAGDEAGVVAGGGDLDGDGLPEIVVGCPQDRSAGTGAGRAYVLFGSTTTGVGYLADADVLLEGETSYAYAGQALTLAGDLDGDGLDDLLVGSPGGSTGSFTAGAAYLLSGATLSSWAGRTVSLGEADGVVEGEKDGDNAGYAVTGGRDVDGDGAVDLLVGAWNESTFSVSGGAAYVVQGPVLGTVDLATSWIKIVSDDASGFLGSSLSWAGDLDADGRGDLLVGISGDEEAHADAGAAWLLLSSEL